MKFEPVAFLGQNVEAHDNFTHVSRTKILTGYSIVIVYFASDCITPTPPGSCRLLES